MVPFGCFVWMILWITRDYAFSSFFLFSISYYIIARPRGTLVLVFFFVIVIALRKSTDFQKVSRYMW